MFIAASLTIVAFLSGCPTNIQAGDYRLYTINGIVTKADEETGINNLKLLSDGIYGIQILTVDSHVKKEKFVSSHLHLDCCFLFEANEKDNLRIKKDENSGVKWIDIDKVTEITNEEKMKPIYAKLNSKIKNI